MVSATDITAGIASLRLAYDMARGIKDIADATERNSKVLDLQRAIMDAQASAMDAQQAHAADVKRIDNLEEEVARLKAWDGEKERYELKTIGHGAFVYSMKPGMEGGEPAHWLCTSCYQKRKKSFLQEVGRVPGERSNAIWRCQDQECQARVVVHYTRSPQKPES